MDDESLLELSLPTDVLQPLFSASGSSSLEEALQVLIGSSRTYNGRSDIASRAILPKVLRLSQSLPYPSSSQYLIRSLKLLRNLCAGEIANQNSFVAQNGVEIVSTILQSTYPDCGISQMGLQILANVCLAGEQHQEAVWDQLFPDQFIMLARVRSCETCDPLCKVIYVCVEESPQMVAELCKDQGLVIVAEAIRTASGVGFREDWLKLLLSRICLEGAHFPILFSKLCEVCATEDTEGVDSSKNDAFSSEQAFLLRIMSEIVNERIREISTPDALGLCILEIFRRSVEVVDFASRGKSGLPTGCTAIDVMGYSLILLRDICARESLGGFKEDGGDVVDALLSFGLLDLLLCLLYQLEPPALIRRGLKQSGSQEGTSSCPSKPSPYKGFRRDIVAVIGNCGYQRKHVQDDIREKNGILLLLQQCVTDEENPFLREWGIWCVRNLLEGNEKNKRMVEDLELQGSVDVPELTDLGLKVEVDQRTHRARLVNVSNHKID